jgi:hypothetical protein
MATSATIRNLLAQGMAGVAKANAVQTAAGEARTSAYTLFVQAAAECGAQASFVAAVDELFAEIRVSATVSDADGNTYSVNAKPGKDGNGFVIPGPFMTAKSIMSDALGRGVPLREDGSERSYTSIRKDVKALKDAEDRAKATGDDRIRLDTLDMLAALTEAAQDAKGPLLADLYRRVRKAAAPVTIKDAPAAPAQEAQAEALAQAA